MTEQPILRVRGVSKSYGRRIGCADVDLDVYAGEVVAVVGESGSGKTTLLNCLGGNLEPDAGSIAYRFTGDDWQEFLTLSESRRRLLMRTELGFVRQNPRDGLRLRVTAGANVGERLMAVGARHYGRIREAAVEWLERVEIDAGRIDDFPLAFSGGMQQRLQIARNLVSGPKLVYMDEPTGGLDVSVQARLLDLLRRLADDLGLAAVIVTHDLGVARLLAERMMVMRGGRVVESGLTDQLLDDPQHPYTQLLAASVLTP
ncbi:MAG: phosphonate C-P lyase system protein PhnK [Acidobacteria bacterium]|nr:phosphonate C-P lyase system protein PhnK [Acidobacteriota bacterium]